MKPTVNEGSPGRARWALILLGVVLVSGCASSRVDWKDRVGLYTHDQAITDLGPPDKEATTSDGSKVAEWMVRRGQDGGVVTYHGSMYPRPYGYRRPYYSTGWSSYYETGSPDSWLRLVFGPDGVLREWKEFRK